jgi:hypothetical protein
LDKAILDLNTAINLDPSAAINCHDHTAVYLAKKQFTLAFVDNNLAIQLDLQNPDYHLLVAKLDEKETQVKITEYKKCNETLLHLQNN